ncbi:MAG: NAD(P)H-dependent glycerol-3-phosphate dehydrogenase [Cyanobacteriota bacterium]
MGLRIAVLGQGAWGLTLARLFRHQGHQLQTWCRGDGTDPTDLLPHQDLVVAAVSMAGVEPLIERLAGPWPDGLPLMSCTKGLDGQALCTPSVLWSRIVPSTSLLVLSGPNLASELDQGLPAASVLASSHLALARRLQQELSSEQLRLYTNPDPLGTEVAGALKNVMAVAAGVCDGLGLGANARASLLCRGLAEMGNVVRGLGGQPSSLYGLAGLGDLLATATSPLSRNYRFGLLLAEGHDTAAALERIGATVEGPNTARAVLRLARQEGWHLPICDQVVALVDGECQPRQAVQALMERDLRHELP